MLKMLKILDSVWFQVKNNNATKNWILVAHKKSTSSQSLSRTSQNNSPCSEKGLTRRAKILVMHQETYYVRITLMIC